MVNILDILAARLSSRFNFFHQGWGDLTYIEHLYKIGIIPANRGI